jgi:thioesterase domain-containing protein
MADVFGGDIAASQLHSLFETFTANMRALRAYSPATYSGRVVVFRAQDGLRDSSDLSWGWQRLAKGGVDLHVVQGDHFSILRRPHVELLAARLSACLDTRKMQSHA